MSHSEIRLGRLGRPTAAIKRPLIETCAGTGRRTCCWGAPTTPPAWTCGAPAASSWRCCWATLPSPGCETPGTSWTRSSAWWAPPPRTAGPASPGSPTTARTSSSATQPRPEDRSAVSPGQGKTINKYFLHSVSAAGARLAAAARHPLRRAPGERAAAAARAEARVRGGCAAAPLLQRPAGQPAQPPPPGQRVQRAGRHLQPRQRQVSSLPHCIDFGAFMPSTPSIY